MHTWPVHDAKARFSELLDTCIHEGPQLLTRRGVDTAVLVPIEEWKRLREAAQPSLKALLLSSLDREDIEIPQRGSAQRRTIPTLGR